MYTFDSRVRYSETDENGNLSLESLIDYMQDCTNFQSEDLGVGLEYHRQKNIMWVLNFWQIVIDEYPAMGENITVGTQAFGFEKMFGHRNFLITHQGEPEHRIAIANSLWVLMDLKKGRPMIVTPEIGDVYGIHEPLPMDYASRKIKVPKDGGEECDPFLVQEYHLDTNHHMNNGQYVRMARAALEREITVRELRVEYRKQAMLGDQITPVIYETEEYCMVSLNGEDGKPYAVVQLFER